MRFDGRRSLQQCTRTGRTRALGRLRTQDKAPAAGQLAVSHRRFSLSLCATACVHRLTSVFTSDRVTLALRVHRDRVARTESTLDASDLLLKDPVEEPHFKVTVPCASRRHVHRFLSTTHDDLSNIGGGALSARRDRVASSMNLSQTHVRLARHDRRAVQRRLASIGLDVRQVLLVSVRVLVRADRPDLEKPKKGRQRDSATTELDPNLARTLADLSLDEVMK